LLVRDENGELTSKRIEEIGVGEWVLSRDEHDSHGELGEVLELHIGGRVIRPC
jgi:hypothetical protein